MRSERADMPQDRELLVVMVREPVPGRVKTRLAAQIGDDAACGIYQRLLERTSQVIESIPVEICISFDGNPASDGLWRPQGYRIDVQSKGDLGERMMAEFTRNFHLGYDKICLIGSDILDLQERDIIGAFDDLLPGTVVLGPARDGGYYLLGAHREQNDILPALFNQMNWGTGKVLRQTQKAIGTIGLKCRLGQLRSDIDTVQDLPPSWLQG